MAEDRSILRTIRKMIGPAADYHYFDADLIMNINAAFSRLCQLGVGPERPFFITGEEESWCDFISHGYMEEIKQYIYLTVRLIFDPPANATVVNIYKEQIDKLEWLLKEVSVTGY